MTTNDNADNKVYVGLADRADLEKRLRVLTRDNETPTPDGTSKEEMINLANALVRGEQIDCGTWIFDLLPEVSLSGEQYTGLRERVTIEPDGNVWLTPHS